MTASEVPAIDRPRRPQWRGERRAVLVRLPLPVADRLVAEVAARQGTISNVAAQLIEQGLQARPDVAFGQQVAS